MPQFRVGQGFDVHPFSEGRPLILGGIDVPHARGLAGHSDADVLLHATIDALLGAAGLGDIGTHFPSSEPRYAGIASSELLRGAWSQIQGQWQLGNIDATIIAQEPRLAPYLASMRAHISEVLGVSPELVNVKATTTDRLGAVGRGEGIGAVAVALLESKE
jgi:2-C-methyl-D-erythritol 2,4-cyclodiphosphate synthase